MFFDAPFPAGMEDFSILFGQLPTVMRSAPALARMLDVSERSIRDWLAGRRAAPRAVRFFLWAYSPACINWVNERAHSDAQEAGRQFIAAQARADDLAGTVAALQQELGDLKRRAAPSRDVAANDPATDPRPRPRPRPMPGRQRA